MIKFDDLPLEIQRRMLGLQKEQGNPVIPEVFKCSIANDRKGGGFTWRDTVEGHKFWKDILEEGKLNIFYKKYPKTQEVKPEWEVGVPEFRFPNSLSILRYAEDATDDSLYIGEGFNTTIGEVKTQAIKDLLEVMMPLTLVSKIRWAMSYMDIRTEEPFFTPEERGKLKDLLNLVSIDI